MGYELDAAGVKRLEEFFADGCHDVLYAIARRRRRAAIGFFDEFVAAQVKDRA